MTYGDQKLLPPDPVPLLTPVRERIGKLRVRQRLHALCAACVVERQEHVAVQLVVTTPCAEAPELIHPGNSFQASGSSCRRPLLSGLTRGRLRRASLLLMVIQAAPLRAAQRRMGLCHHLEARGSVLLFLGAHLVWVKLLCKLVVGLLDRGGCGVVGDLEYVVQAVR